MPPDEPSWWYEEKVSLTARLLSPVSMVWARVADRRFDRTIPYRAPVPVICIGNFTTGGTGKTPLAIFLTQWLVSRGYRPAVLSRGYGGRIAGPHVIDPEKDAATDVGDEPLLLARNVPVMISRDRARGASALVEQCPDTDVIVMDDGLQNPTIAKDLSISVVDGRRGLGNRRVMPSGPLRGRLESQLARTDLIVINRRPSDAGLPCPVADAMRHEFHGPVITATASPSEDTAWLRGLKVHAFTGIGAPIRFFEMLRGLGSDVARERPFPDHHLFTEAEASDLLDRAAADGAVLVTTEKDWVRLAPADSRRGELRKIARPVPVSVHFSDVDRDRLETSILGAIAGHKLVP